MRLKTALIGLSLPIFLFSCASSQTATQPTTLQDPDVQAIEAKSEKAFKELKEEFQPKTTNSTSNETATPKEKPQEEPLKEKTTSPKKISGKIIFKECAYGKDQRDSRNTAIKRLAQDILSNVSALEIAQRSLHKGKVSREYFSQTKIKTRTILKGIIFQDIGRTSEGYEICAVLTEKSLKETISYLKSTLNRNLITLPKSELEELKTQTFILLSIGESTNDKEAVKFATEKLKEIDKILNFGRLNVNTVPSKATITIGNKKYSTGQTILLEPNKEYFVTIKANGYKTVRKRIYIGRGEMKNISIELPKVIKKDIPISIKTNIPFIKDLTEKALIDSGFHVRKNATNTLSIIMKDYSSDINGYTKHEIVITATITSNGKPILQKRGKLKPFFTTEKTENSILKAKIEKLAKAVLNSLLNNVNPEQLGGGEK